MPHYYADDYAYYYAARPYYSTMPPLYRLNSYAEVLCPAEQGGSYKTALEGKCPTCRKPISKSKRRMLGKL